MAQYDVHLNPGPMRGTVPMVVVPLVLRSALPKGTQIAGTRLNPAFTLCGQDVVLHPLDMVSVAQDQLGLCVGSVADQGQAIADALDELLTRNWG